MRVWDIDPKLLCRQHLLGQHREIHAIWNMITQNKGGSYQSHPEVKRWKENMPLLNWVHNDTVLEMKRRGYNHQSPLKITDLRTQYLIKRFLWPEQWQTTEQQIEILRAKKCLCEVYDQ